MIHLHNFVTMIVYLVNLFTSFEWHSNKITAKGKSYINITYHSDPLRKLKYVAVWNKKSTLTVLYEINELKIEVRIPYLDQPRQINPDTINNILKINNPSTSYNYVTRTTTTIQSTESI